MSRKAWIVLFVLVALVVLWYFYGPAATASSNNSGVASRVRQPSGISGGETVVTIDNFNAGGFSVGKLGFTI